MSIIDTSPYDTITGSRMASQVFANSILGPPVVGWVVQIMGFGALLTYFSMYVASPAFANDGPRLRWLLCVVFALCALESGIAFWLIYHYSTWQGRSAEVLYGQTIADAMSVIPVGVEGAIVQAFLAHRTSGLFAIRWRKYLFLAFIGAGILTGLYGSVAYTVLSVYDRAGKIDLVLPLTFQNATGAWLWGCAVVDITITIGLGVQLYQKLGGINETTNNILTRLIRGAIQTASYTTVLAVLGAILDFSLPPPSLSNQAAIAFYGPLSSCYALALLHTLASRSEIRQLQSSGGSGGGGGIGIGGRGGVTLSVLRTVVTSGGGGDEEMADFTPNKFARVELTRGGDQRYSENLKVGSMPFGEAAVGGGRGPGGAW